VLGFGPPAERQARREWWRRQIQRQQQSPVTVAEFCRRHGIKPVTFYSWRRRLRNHSATSGQTRPQPQSRPKPVTGSNATTNAPFVPVTLVERGSTAQLEIELGDICTVRVNGTVDPRLLRVAIRAAGQFGGAKQGAR
jgi:transposase-like protein